MSRRYSQCDRDAEGFQLLVFISFLVLGTVYYSRDAIFRNLPAIICSAAVLIVGVFSLIWYRQKRKKNHLEKVFQQIKEKDFHTGIGKFLSMFGKEGTHDKTAWVYRDYSISWKRLEEFREQMHQDDIDIDMKGFSELHSVLTYYIDQKEQKFLHESIISNQSSDLNALSKKGDEFEILITRLYNAMGYEAKRIGRHGDQGGDVIANKNGESLLIQAKYYSGSVGNAAVQQAVAARTHYGCSKAVVVTSSHFTPEAIALAKTNSIELVDRRLLQQRLSEFLHEAWS